MTPPRIVPYCTIPGLFHDATAGGEDGELHIYVPSGAVPDGAVPVDGGLPEKSKAAMTTEILHMRLLASSLNK